MRTACVLALACLAAPAPAQTAPYLAEVVAESVALRSGPGDQMPDTGALFRGGRVVVDHEEGDKWLAVQPPRGQVSWIKGLNLGPVDGQAGDVIPRNAVVHADPDAEIALGRPGLGKPLDVRRTRVPDQTIVLVIGQKVDYNGSAWYPVEPPDGDFRYLPKSAVRFLKGQPAQAFVVRQPKPPDATDPGKGGDAPAPLASIPGPGTGAARRPDNWPNHPLWQQAEDAERRGDYGRAEALYIRLAGEMNKPGGDADLANLCYTRVHALREKERQAGQGRGSRQPDRGADPGEPRWAGPGVLREAGFRFDQRPTYALVNEKGKVICYAIGGRSVGLDRFVREEVLLYGAVDFPGDLRGAGIMTVSHVRRPEER